MDKNELLRLDPHNKKDPKWVEAFKLYKEAFPNSEEHIGCRSCRQRVLKWLKYG